MIQLDSDKVALGILMAIVIASGCTNGDQSGVTVDQTSGLTIQSFSPATAEVFSGQPVSLEMTVENSGGRDAENVKATIFNIPTDSGSSGDASRTWSVSGDVTKSLDTIRSADPETDAPAVPRTVTWGLESPQLDQGVTIPYDIFTRVYYEYSTKGTTQIQVMDSDRYRDSGATRSTPTVDNSGGPIQLEVRTRTPIVFYDSSDSPSSQFCVIAKNQGTGTPTVTGAGSGDIKSISDSEKNKVELRVDVSGSTLQFADSSNGQSATETVEIVGSEGVNCFELETSGSAGNLQTTLPVTVTANYGYYIEDQTSVTVEGTRESESSSDGGEDGGAADTSPGVN